MIDLDPEFDNFLACWHQLPRRAHSILPCKSDITPFSFGEVLKHVGFAEMLAPYNLKIFFAGSGFERNAGFEVTGKNYYDILPKAFQEPMAAFHKYLLGTPCGAYIADVISTTSGNQYIHHNVQMPVCDDTGQVKYLLAYGLDRKPYDDKGTRTDSSHAPSNIKDMFYIDLGAGAPSAYVTDFKFHRSSLPLT
mgnify:CR=1 FL=1